jgi:DNA-directed RNA polymerase specialized sigma subunit
MTDKEIITNYHDTVLLIHGLRQRIDWNQRHGLPVADLQQKNNQLMHELLRAEDILSDIPDIRHRIVVCLYYMLGMRRSHIAAILNVSKAQVGKLCVDALAEIH